MTSCAWNKPRMAPKISIVNFWNCLNWKISPPKMLLKKLSMTSIVSSRRWVIISRITKERRFLMMSRIKIKNRKWRTIWMELLSGKNLMSSGMMLLGLPRLKTHLSRPSSCQCVFHRYSKVIENLGREFFSMVLLAQVKHL